MIPRVPLLALALVALVAAPALTACGARSGLPYDEPRAVEVADAGPDADTPIDCIKAGVTFIYVITEQEDLFEFYPPTRSLFRIGHLSCPGSSGATPFSMAVDRTNTAFVVYGDGMLFKVSTKDASCEATSFVPDQDGFHTFGMGFAADAPGAAAGETLYVAEGHPGGSGPSAGLATIATDSFALHVIGPFSGDVGTGGELTGTGDGRLFTFFPSLDGSGSHVDEVDKSNAAILSDVAIPAGDQTSAFAFSFWGGDFYIFTAPSGGTTTVTRFTPSDGTSTTYATFDETVVGAGVSTCAPR